MSIKRLAVGVVLVACASLAWSTPGGVDASGCHDSEKIGRHCHPQRLKAGGYAGGESAAQRSKRLDKECKGMQDAGMCSGHVKKPRG